MLNTQDKNFKIPATTTIPFISPFTYIIFYKNLGKALTPLINIFNNLFRLLLFIIILILEYKYFPLLAILY